MKNYILTSIIIFFFCLLVAFQSCKKKNEKLIVFGTAFNFEISQPVGNIKVILSARSITNNVWNSNYDILSTTYTHNDGSFSFEFDNVRASDYKLSFIKAGNFTEDYIINPNLLQKGGDYNQTYPVHQEGWLKLLINVTNPNSTGVSVSLKIKKGAANCQEGCNDTLLFFDGAAIDTFHICKIWGSQWEIGRAHV